MCGEYDGMVLDRSRPNVSLGSEINDGLGEETSDRDLPDLPLELSELDVLEDDRRLFLPTPSLRLGRKSPEVADMLDWLEELGTVADEL